MNAFQTFVLFYCALGGLLLAVFAPDRYWSKQTKGMDPQEIADYKAQKTKLGVSRGRLQWIIRLAELVYQYAVEPAYVFWAIFAPIYPSELAYAAFAMVLVKIVSQVAVFLASVPKAESVVHSQFYWIGVVVWSFPTLYLWFVLFVMISLAR